MNINLCLIHTHEHKSHTTQNIHTPTLIHITNIHTPIDTNTHTPTDTCTNTSTYHLCDHVFGVSTNVYL